MVETRIVYSIFKEQGEFYSPYVLTCYMNSSHALTFRSPGLLPVEESLVEMSGIEPLTPCLQSRCSPI